MLTIEKSEDGIVTTVTGSTIKEVKSMLIDLAVLETIKGREVFFHTFTGLDYDVNSFEAEYQLLKKLSGASLKVSQGNTIDVNDIPDSCVVFVDDRVPNLREITSKMQCCFIGHVA